MPRKAYVADLEAAKSGSPPPNISGIRNGEDDGSFEFDFNVPGTASQKLVSVHVMIPELSDYPKEHSCMIFTTSDNPPEAVNDALQSISVDGQTISKILSSISSKLSKALSNGSRSAPFTVDADDDIVMADADAEDGASGSDNDSEGGWSIDSDGFNEEGLPQTQSRTSLSTEALRKTNARVRADLKTVKEAGFKVGLIGAVTKGEPDFYISISVRAAKLGISEEALQAWRIDPQKYLVLLIHYTNGYLPIETLIALDASQSRRSVEMRVGMGRKYKPTKTEAIAAFSKAGTEESGKQHVVVTEQGSIKLTSDSQVEASVGPNSSAYESKNRASSSAEDGFQGLFIGRPLNELLNDRLILILKIRITYAFGWGGAEKYYSDHQASGLSTGDLIDQSYYEPEIHPVALPPLVTADQLTSESAKSQTSFSFPLLGMQFLLRHLVRCTEFCLVCHNRVHSTFEALKPYVCSNPLCLYQYMSLGFGPSIEYEIISQPNVVDLLVSLCYYSASKGRLKDFPTGMSLMVPIPVGPGIELSKSARGALQALPPQVDTTAAPTIPTDDNVGWQAVKYDRNTSELIFDGPGVSAWAGFGANPCPLKKGGWILLRVPPEFDKADCRVAEVAFYPTVKVTLLPSAIDLHGSTEGSAENMPASANVNTPAATPPLTNIVTAHFRKYEHNFDELSDQHKRECISHVLRSLPSVSQMRRYLTSGEGTHRIGGEVSLSSWSDRISPAALGILRWVIASNRSCILEVVEPTGYESQDASRGRVVEDRVRGMPGFAQFRFAMGAPDKEQRFQNELQAVSQRLQLAHPTIFAWHGSLLENWHSIIREGLHFNEVLNGRAFGNGVYFAKQASYSIGYANIHRYGAGLDGSSTHSGWPQSDLKPTCCLALNEIINARKEFVHGGDGARGNSEILVVSQLDWIQSRYLFVQTSVKEYATVDQGQGTAITASTPQTERALTSEYRQDPSFTAVGLPAGGGYGVNGPPVSLPLAAVPRSRRKQLAETQSGAAFFATPQSSTKGTKRKKTPKSAKSQKSPKVTTTAGTFAPSREIIVLDSSDNDAESVSTDIDDLEVLFSEDEGDSKSDKGKGKEIQHSPTSAKPLTDFVPGTLDWSTLPLLRPPTYATSTATSTLSRELKKLLAVQKSQPLHELGWYLDAERVENVYQWIVELHSFDPTLPLTADMKTKGIKSIVLEIRFGASYPMSPPFVRVIRPRFVGFAAGGGGHVTLGGALCMELLTNSGWSAVSSIESVLLQVRMAMSSTDPKPARLVLGRDSGDYGVHEAKEAYVRACYMHGWQVPADLTAMVQEG